MLKFLTSIVIVIALAIHAPFAEGACGDCNQDGLTNVLDALVAAQTGASLLVLTAPAFLDCNIAGTAGPAPSGTVDVLDALRIAQYSAGLGVALVCDDPVGLVNCGAADSRTIMVAGGGPPPMLSMVGSTRFYSINAPAVGIQALEVTLSFAAPSIYELLIGDVGTTPGATSAPAYRFYATGASPLIVRIDSTSTPTLDAYRTAGLPIAIAVYLRSTPGASYDLTIACQGAPPMGPSVTLTVEEPAGVARAGELVTSGVPFPRGALPALSACYLTDSSGALAPAQFRSLLDWPDGSVKWLLVDFMASLPAGGAANYQLRCDGARVNPPPPTPLVYAPGSVNTGAAQFTFDPAAFDLFSSVTVGGQSVVSGGHGIELVASGGAIFASENSTANVSVVEQGPLKLVLQVRTAHRDGMGVRRGNSTCWLVFAAGSSLVRLFHRVENDLPMSHPNNFWDLGAAGSLRFDELRLGLDLSFGPGGNVEIAGTSGLVSGAVASSARIYQDSSSGPNWNSQNHIDGSSTVQTTFRGYRTFLDGAQVDTGNRPLGYLDVSNGVVGAAIAIRNFWQNFPNELRLTAGRIDVALWPAAFAFDHEVQGGEQKTHEVMLYFHTGSAAAAGAHARARAFEAPLFARAPAAWYASSKAVGDFVPYSPALYQRYEEICETIHTPHGSNPRSAVSQREPIDEYGWRNWGEMMADHETDGYVQSWDVPISHYNNQYDAAFGSLLCYLRTGERDYMDYGEAYSRHTADIDINHTTTDGVYSGGHFWHTTHDVNALTSTHRTWSVDHAATYPGQPWLDGGGPGLGHIYIRGLWLLHYLKGYHPAREAALEVANFVDPFYQATGAGARESREAGNLLMTLAWSYRHTDDPAHYATMMECITATGASTAWVGLGGMYPQGLGEFLKMKTERGEAGDPDYNLALGHLLTICDSILTQPLAGVSVPYIHFTEALLMAHRYAPLAHPNRNAYRTRAGALWNAILFPTSDYPSAKPLSMWISTSHSWPYFEQGGQ